VLLSEKGEKLKNKVTNTKKAKVIFCNFFFGKIVSCFVGNFIKFLFRFFVVVQRGKQERPEGKKKKRKECSCACVVLDVHFLHLYCFFALSPLVVFSYWRQKIERNRKEPRRRKRKKESKKTNTVSTLSWEGDSAERGLQVCANGRKKDETKRKKVRSEKWGKESQLA